MADATHARRLLVVDDEQDSADMLAQLLQLLLPGWNVEVAYGGQAAVEHARRERPDAVVTDLEMPGLDGVGTAIVLRAEAQGTALVLVAVSGNLGKVASTAVAGVFDHALPKPVDVAALGRLLEPA